MALTSPIQAYEALLLAKKLQPNEYQAQLIQELHHVFLALNTSDPWWQRMLQPSHFTKGIYIWGSVGAGKTAMMDLFVNCMPAEQVLRIHFHQFMKQVHEKLTELTGVSNPLDLIAKDIAKRALVLCLDEFIVEDIVDAMLLRGLLIALFAQRICLITTSNTEPDRLYEYGLQRIAFLPAIELIKKNSRIIKLETPCDYRMLHAHSGEANLATTPQHASLLEPFKQLAITKLVWNHYIMINEHSIATLAQSDEAVWFNFAEICHIPRNTADYLEIAKRYKIVFISNIPQISKDDINSAHYLIALVDVFYDAKINLIFSSNVAIDAIYPEGKLVGDFQRTKSRLIEMQAQATFNTQTML